MQEFDLESCYLIPRLIIANDSICTKVHIDQPGGLVRTYFDAFSYARGR